jgi:lipoprotein-anchoring transpeptidase ErfK/SrfK
MEFRPSGADAAARREADNLMPAMGRRVSLTAVGALLAVLSLGPAPAGAVAIAPKQRLAQVMTPHGVRARPDGHAPVIEVVQPRRPITNERTILPVLAHHRGRQGVMWLKVLLPGRPNSHTGWIKKLGTVGATTRWAIVVRLTQRRVDVFRNGRPAESFRAVVGKPSTPTPQGRFFVEEWLSIIPGYPGGPFALALSARSNVYQEFEGGPGQIALHGIYRIGGTPGTAASHGCVRLDSPAMAWLGTHIHGGVPVTITR